MAKATNKYRTEKGAKAVARYRADFSGFVDTYMTKEAKADFRTWIETGVSTLPDMIARLVDSGYAFSCRPGPSGEDYIAQIQCYDEDNSDDFGYILRSYSNDPTTSMYLAMFKFHIMLEGRLVNGVSDDEGDEYSLR